MELVQSHKKDFSEDITIDGIHFEIDPLLKGFINQFGKIVIDFKNLFLVKGFILSYERINPC